MRRELYYWVSSCILSSLILLIAVTQAFAVPDGNWKFKTKTATSWVISGSVTNNTLTMKDGTCATKSASADKLTGSCVYQTGYCSKGSKVRVTVKAASSGKLRATVSGKCNRGRF